MRGQKKINHTTLNFQGDLLASLLPPNCSLPHRISGHPLLTFLKTHHVLFYTYFCDHSMFASLIGLNPPRGPGTLPAWFTAALWCLSHVHNRLCQCSRMSQVVCSRISPQNPLLKGLITVGRSSLTADGTQISPSEVTLQKNDPPSAVQLAQRTLERGIWGRES